MLDLQKIQHVKSNNFYLKLFDSKIKLNGNWLETTTYFGEGGFVYSRLKNDFDDSFFHYTKLTTKQKIVMFLINKLLKIIEPKN